MTSFVLVHSPSVGPATWAGVAGRLRESGHGVVVPSLLGVTDGEAPYWPGVVAAVNAGWRGLRLASRSCWWRTATRAYSCR